MSEKSVLASEARFFLSLKRKARSKNLMETGRRSEGPSAKLGTLADSELLRKVMRVYSLGQANIVLA